MNTRHRTATAGFTLVEILVVLGVVAVLTSILFAVMGRVRESGRATVCQSSLKQLALALQQYVADSDGRFPTDRFQPQLHRYVKPSGWIECPTHEALSLAKQELSLPSGVPDPNLYIFGYTYNGVPLNRDYKIGSSLHRDSKQEAVVPDSAQTWVFADDGPVVVPQGTGAGGFWNPSKCDGIHEGWAELHSGGAHYAFLDGHVKWLKPDAINKMHCSSSSGQ